MPPYRLVSSRGLVRALAPLVCAGLAGWPSFAHAQAPAQGLAPWSPDGATLVRLLGTRAKAAYAPRSAPGMGALVRLPQGARASDWGLSELAPGLARMYGPPAAILALRAAHPDAAIEVTPPLHLLLDTATRYVNTPPPDSGGLDGTGVVIGVADTGIDVTHPDFLDAMGHTRVAWLLDLSATPIGKHPDLEQKFGSTGSSGALAFGAVWSGDDIDAALAAGNSSVPKDEVGHGTLVSSCAAGSGSLGQSKYRGVAPGARLVVARITGSGDESIGNDELLRGVSFLFDRGQAMGQPTVVNLSIGSDFGPHDGSLAWEQALASYVGAGQPGRALVVAAGNSGSILETPVHQNVHVSAGASVRVPVVTQGAQSGGIQVWVAMHAGASLEVGLDAPSETWIDPVKDGQSAGKNTGQFNAAVYNGSGASGSPVPASSHGAVVVWQGTWPAGNYAVTLSGTGTADLYVEPSGDAGGFGTPIVGFANGVRESTISLPATHPAIIGVGCTINKPAWTSQSSSRYGLKVPLLDALGGMALDAGDVSTDSVRDPIDGEPCWFSSAGPTLTGLQKPEIMAPGAAIIGALSRGAVPPAAASIFSTTCISSTGTSDSKCEEIDRDHGISSGTSFSSPLVAGAVALLFQHDPTLTQSDVLAALQGGAHALRSAGAFDDQAGVGELDILGALDAADRIHSVPSVLPSYGASWMTLGAEQALADGSTPVQAVLSLRGASGAGPAGGFDASRLSAYAAVDGKVAAGAVQSLVQRGPGTWVATVKIASGLGGSSLTIGATFDGRDIVLAKRLPIATDVWNGDYPPSLQGGCDASAERPAAGATGLSAALLALAAFARFMARAAPSTESSQRAGATSRRSGRARA